MVVPDTPAAIADAHFVYATTARPRDLTKPVMTPEEAMADAVARIDAGQRVAVLFGPERTGLENDDIVRANAIVTVPVNPEFFSLNLAQAVLLLAYEWGRQGSAVPPAVLELAGKDLAQGQEVEALAAHWEGRLEDAGFFFPPEQVPAMKANRPDAGRGADLSRDAAADRLQAAQAGGVRRGWPAWNRGFCTRRHWA